MKKTSDKKIETVEDILNEDKDLELRDIIRLKKALDRENPHPLRLSKKWYRHPKAE